VNSFLLLVAKILKQCAAHAPNVCLESRHLFHVVTRTKLFVLIAPYALMENTFLIRVDTIVILNAQIVALVMVKRV